MSDCPFIISIGGGSGSGKTTLAKFVMEEVGEENALFLSIDRFYDTPEDPEGFNFDHPDSIDWKLLEEKLNRLLNENQVEIPVYNFETHSRSGWESVKGRKIVILEGIFALVEKSINELSSLRIFVDTDADLRFIRRLKRDLDERGRTMDSVIEQWRNQVKPMHEEFIEPSKRNAHIIVPEDPDGEMRKAVVDLIQSKIQDLIESNK